MEKINVALSEIEDNTNAIRELNKKLTSRTKCRFAVGNVANSVASFGQVTSDGGVGVIVVIPSTTMLTLTFNGETVVTSQSPIVAVLPAGTGELVISPATTSARALIIGG